MKRIFGACIFVLGLSISPIAASLPANSQVDRNIGTMQWNKETNSWEFCESCTMYFTKVTCQ